MAKSKIELILEMKDRMTTSLKRAKEAVASNTEEMKRKMSGLKTSFVDAVSEMRQQLPLLDNALRLVHNPIVLLTSAVAAVGVGIGRLRAFAGECITAYQGQAEAESKLAQVMRNTMGARQEDIDSISRLASEQQRLGVIGDEVQLAGAQELGTYLTKAKNLRMLLPVMNDMVAQQYGYNATQESAVNIATMMGKVMDGQVGALSRYGYKFDEAQEKILKFGTEEQRAATLADVVSQSVGGVNEALSKTPTGSLVQYQNNLSDLQEDFGKFFTDIKAAWLPVGEAFLSGWNMVLDVFNANKDKILNVVQIAANLVASVINGVFTVIGWIKDAAVFIYEWRDAIMAAAAAYAVLNIQQTLAVVKLGAQALWTGILTVKQWALNAAQAANPLGIVIMLISALIGVIVALCRRYEGWATVWNALKVTLVNSLKAYLTYVKFGFTEAWYNIQLFWERVKGFAEYIGILFTNVGKAIKAALSLNFDEAKKILKQDITTTASVRIKELEDQRSANRTQFKEDMLQYAKETADAWRSIELKRKTTEEAEEESETEGGSAPEGSGIGGEYGDGASGSVTDGITGSARQIRNITVNIDAFNKGGINTGNTEGLNGLNATQVEEWFNQMLMRAIRNLELSY